MATANGRRRARHLLLVALARRALTRASVSVESTVSEACREEQRDQVVSRSGQANEAGSVHRRGVALYLAAHGLAGKPVRAADPEVGNPVPVGLAFETSHATDDLLCTLSDGSRLFISAKRTCGNNAHLVDTIEQWLSQSSKLKPGDRLILATAEPRGAVRTLGSALRRRRKAPDSVFPVAEQASLDALRKRMTETGAATAAQDRVLDAAAVLEIDASGVGCPQYEIAATLLDGTVVEAGLGEVIVSHLESHLHNHAGLAYAGDVESWVHYLVDLGLEIAPDRSGPPARATQARRLAVEHYRDKLSSIAGQVDLSLLAEDLDPLVVDDLVDNMQAVLGDENGDPDPDPDVDGVPLPVLARRMPRLLLLGLPGSGKSAAIAQLGARWAKDPSMPLPVVVRLSDLAERCQSSADVSLSLLCELAAARAPQSERRDLVDIMHGAIERGDAILLLDGLDECLDRRGVVAQGLKTVLMHLHPETGVLLTSRHSASSAAMRLPLDVAQLSTPSNLTQVLDQLLRNVAKTRIAESKQEAWVADRSHRVRQIREEYKDLGSVPLLAVLITLVAADNDLTALPRTTAGILKSAIRQTISRWEQRRQELPAGFAVRPTESQLMVGFAATGSLLSEHASVTENEVRAAITEAMVARWQLPRDPAEEIAGAIQWFWDERVGVFVSDRIGNVNARSRVFAEVGVALQCPSLSYAALGEWVAKSVEDPEQHTALLLAAEIDARVIQVLLTPDSDSDSRALLTARALHNGAEFDDDQMATLLDWIHNLARKVVDQAAINQSKNVSLVWSWAWEIANLPLSPALEARRNEHLADLPLTAEQLKVSRGVSAIKAADFACRHLTKNEIGLVMDLLSVPVPAEGEPLKQVSRRRFALSTRAGLLEGLGQAVVNAAERLPELPNSAGKRIKDFSERVGWKDAREIARIMARYGHELPTGRPSAAIKAQLANATDFLEVDYRTILETIAMLSDQDVKLSACQQWRLPQLCELFHLLETVEDTVSSLRAAAEIDTPQMRFTWLRTMTLVAGMDLPVIAAQAQLALDEFVGSSQIYALLKLIFIKPEEKTWFLDLGQLGSDALAAPLFMLTAESDWIARSAVRLLWESDVPGLTTEIDVLLDEVSPRRRFMLAILRWSVSGGSRERLIRSYFESVDPVLRRAAASLVRREDSPPALSDLRMSALDDDDATIRVTAGATTLDAQSVSKPKYWSCAHCSGPNEMSTEDCSTCEEGTRPEVDKSSIGN